MIIDAFSDTDSKTLSFRVHVRFVLSDPDFNGFGKTISLHADTMLS